ncbi:hypothetical protein TNCV_3363001 [Trichonephila clavipes]|nr:hypothetical protein TNCV_3363001 [Trichonephila clavipes]
MEHVQRKIEELKELLFGLETAKPKEEAEFEEDLYKCETRLEDLEGRVVVYRASTPQILGSINGLGKVDSAFHPRYIGSINEYYSRSINELASGLKH